MPVPGVMQLVTQLKQAAVCRILKEDSVSMVCERIAWYTNTVKLLTVV